MLPTTLNKRLVIVQDDQSFKTVVLAYLHKQEKGKVWKTLMKKCKNAKEEDLRNLLTELQHTLIAQTSKQ